MGNLFSFRQPSALSELVNRRPAETEEQLSKERLEDGLLAVANALHAKKLNISIVAVGGAVNTILLKSRTSTSDVDFFYRTKTKNNDVTNVIIAAEDARKILKLGEQWLNNHTAVFMDEGLVKILYDEAVRQDEVVFNKSGLKVYAAPWRYALAAKLDRLAKPGARPYDMSDAADYLARLIAKRGGTVKRSELKQWAKEFGFKPEPTKQLIDRLAEEYKKKTHKDGIVDG